MKLKWRLLIAAVLALSFAGVDAGAQSLLRNGRIPSDLVITLERSRCFKRCPNYKLTIDASGKVTFDGRRDTKVSGIATGEVSVLELKDLIKRFESSRFLSLKGDYEAQTYCRPIATDLPSETISITASGRSKRVSHYFGCFGKGVASELKRLSALGKSIDQVTDSNRWVGGK